MNKFDLTGKTVLITGAAGLLGVEHAIAVLENGATVILTDVCQHRLFAVHEQLSVSFSSKQVVASLMDVTRIESIRHVANEWIVHDKRIDVLINNAAIDPKVDALEACRLETFAMMQWERELAVGLTGAFLCSQVFGSQMASDGKGGVILNVASDLSVFSPDQRLYRQNGLPDDKQPVKPVTYSVIKTGLIGLTRYLSTYWADVGIRSNALSPGGVFTNQPEQFVRDISSRIPLGRMAHRDEYHSAIQFLCSDASAYLNGQNIVMDGGRSVW